MKKSCTYFDCTHPLIYLTESNDESNFRKKIAVTKEYKGNRKKQDKPAHYEAVRQYLKENYDTQVIKGYEADDALGINHTKNKDTTVIVTIDKDLVQIPGKHFNLDSLKYFEVDELEGARSLFTQVLQGDAADDVPGAPGLGKGRVKELLKDATSIRELYEITRSPYDPTTKLGQKHIPYWTEEKWLESCNLVFIFREKGETFEQWSRKYAN